MPPQNLTLPRGLKNALCPPLTIAPTNPKLMGLAFNYKLSSKSETLKTMHAEEPEPPKEHLRVSTIKIKKTAHIRELRGGAQRCRSSPWPTKKLSPNQQYFSSAETQFRGNHSTRFPSPNQLRKSFHSSGLHSWGRGGAAHPMPWPSVTRYS